MCCLLFFSGDPVEGDPKQSRANQFQISMMQGSNSVVLTAPLSCSFATFTLKIQLNHT
jgi:hypothetical protein